MLVRMRLPCHFRTFPHALPISFVPFLIFGYPASMTIKAIGYKHTMALSFAMFAVAFGLYIPSASQESFPLFLVASFVSGTANAFLQASVNPYITILGPLESAAKRISIMGICNKLAWPIPPLFLAFLIGKEVSDITVSDMPRHLLHCRPRRLLLLQAAEPSVR